MQRRKMLAALGSVAVGGATAVSTGAFTSVQADRDLSINVANDSEAFLAIKPEDTPNGRQYATQGSDGSLDLDFSQTDDNGSGLNQNADTIIRDVFTITNQGTQTVVVDVSNLPDGMSIFTDDGDEAPPGSPDASGSSMNSDKKTNELPRAEPGTTIERIGVIFRGSGDDSSLSNLENFEGTITINAATEEERN